MELLPSSQVRPEFAVRLAAPMVVFIMVDMTQNGGLGPGGTHDLSREGWVAVPSNVMVGGRRMMVFTKTVNAGETVIVTCDTPCRQSFTVDPGFQNR